MFSGGVSKLATSLTIIFVISLVALFLELFYILWRRHHLHRSIPTTTTSHHLTKSKQQLLYFFSCLKRNLSKIEPKSSSSSARDEASAEDEMEVIDVFKLLYMKGPSRVLYTIKEEEETEGVESSDEKEKNKCGSKKMSLKECFECVQDPPTTTTPPPPLEVAVKIDDDQLGNGDATTPFSTPCASPLFFTPSASPTCEIAIQC